MKNELKSLKDLKDEADPDVEVHALRRQVANLKQEIKAMQRDYGDLRGYFRDVDIVARELILEPGKPEYKQPKKGSRVASECLAVLHWTDWHYGQVVSGNELEGMSSFSPEQCEARVLNLSLDFIAWVEVLRSAYRMDELLILDTGDNISGDIHQELSVTNAFPAPVQAMRCGKLKAENIETLSRFFKKVRVEFVTSDNHGRLTRKPQAAQAGLNTHNYVVGHVAKLLTEKLPNVEFNVHISHTKAVPALTRQYLLTHGHDVMGWAGFPYYGIERKVSREALVRLWEPDHRKFHKVIMGHWHAPLAHPWYWIGGSVSGTTEYDHKQGRRARESQVSWIVHPRHGEFNRTEFYLRDI